MTELRPESYGKHHIKFIQHNDSSGVTALIHNNRYQLVKTFKTKTKGESFSLSKDYIDNLKISESDKIVKKLNSHALQKIKNTRLASRLIDERVDLDGNIQVFLRNLSNDTRSGKLFNLSPIDPTYGTYFVDINFLRNHRGNEVIQNSSWKSVDDLKKLIKEGTKMRDIPGFELRDLTVGEGNHRVEALYQLGYKSVPVQLWSAW